MYVQEEITRDLVMLQDMTKFVLSKIKDTSASQ